MSVTAKPSTVECVLCGATDGLRYIENYAGVHGANAWVCRNSYKCATDQMRYGAAASVPK